MYPHSSPGRLKRAAPLEGRLSEARIAAGQVIAMNCEQCQNAAEVHFILKAEKQTTQHAAEMRHFCAHCGRAFVRRLPAPQLVGFCTNKLPEESELTRQFCVVSDSLYDRALLEVAEVRESSPGLRRWNVPAELVPPDSRYRGAQFTIQGNPLELEIFTSWFG